MNDRISRRLLARALYATTALCSCPAFAQLAPPAPVRQSVDANGVNLFDGQFYVNAPSLSLGQDEVQGLSYYKLQRSGGWTDNLVATLNLNGSVMTVSLAGKSDTFTVSGSTYANTEGNGATLSFNGTTKVYTYTRADGTVIHFNQNLRSSPTDYSNEGRVTDIVSPSGAKLTFNYESQIYCYSWKQLSTGNRCLTTGTLYRPASVRNSSGYQIAFSYNYNYTYDPDQPEQQPDFYAYSDTTGVSAANLAVASGGTVRSQSWSSALTNNTLFYQITGPMNRTTKYRMSGAKVAGITLPGDTAETTSVAFLNGRVSSITTPDGATNYVASDLNGVRTITVTDPLNHVTTYKFDIASQRMTSVTDANNHTTNATYDGNGRIKRVTKPEGNYTEVSYDGRGNITERREVAKPGTGLTDIVTTAGYDNACANPVTCNQPNWTKDAKGNQTDYSYDPTHGGVVAVTAPAAATGGVRPQTRYGYTSLQAYFKNGSGSIVASGEPVYKLTSISECQTADAVAGPGCAGGADEVKSTISYGPQTAGVGNNLLPGSSNKGSGNGALTATVAATYDDVGNLTYVDGPLAGAVDTARTLYNANREVIGSIDPDPDGSGSMKNRAIRNTIDARSLLIKEEIGTTNGQDDNAWSNFVASKQTDIGYWTDRRPNTFLLSANGTTYSLVHRNYDPAGRVSCTAVRMNPSTWNSLPGACTPATAGPDGDDRITQILYDAAGQPTQFKVAVGTPDEAAERTIEYSANGVAATLTDGEGNRTDTYHDGFDRLGAVFFPSLTKGGGTNYNDKIQIAYDANGNITAKRNRAGALTQFAYDNLNRVQTKDRPGTEPDVSFSYDLLGRMTGASQTGNMLTFGYDALSRQISEGGPIATVGYEYNLAGQRTRTFTSLGYDVRYQRLITGEMTTIADGNNNAQDVFSYDDLRRRTGSPRYYVTTSYGYDAVGRLASLSHAFPASSNSLSISLGYNPASGIKQRSNNNDAFAGAFGNANVSYSSDGLNQYTSIGGGTPAYDANGNLTYDPTSAKTFTYDSENKLTSGTGGVALSYDPLNRLYEVSSSSGTRRFLYATGEAGLPEPISEYNGSNALQHLYVFGPGPDEPVLWQDFTVGGAVRLLEHDERGSIIAVTDSSGNVSATIKYDEYGNPQFGGTLTQRFGYTGQLWLPEFGVQYSKARMYSPALGRFLQADPIGPADDANLYAYVQADPINFTDPTGLKASVACPANAPNCITVTGKGNGGGGPPPMTILPASVTVTSVGGPADQGCDAERQNCNPIEVVGRRKRPKAPSGPVGAPPPLPNSPVKQDYCGSSGSEWVPDGDWSQACRIHDDCYGTAGANKAACDAMLGVNVTANCIEDTWLVPICGAIGIVYWQGVNFGGFGPYFRAQRAARKRGGF